MSVPIIVDEFTGRLMFGRRYNEGLHQAIEAKEHVEIAHESKTLATITFQNYFRLYNKLSGMTGTATTEKDEFASIYKLDIIEIPTNKPVARIDNPDVVYKTEAGKYRAVIRQAKECYEKGQPVLIGTVSIEKNELLSAMLKREGIPHNVLNAKNHEKEAEIIAQAGKFGAVTVATNMAGRGTDIMLGGNAEYLAKNELRKAGYSDEIINEATGYADTDNEEILAARQLFSDSNEKFKAQIADEAEKVRAAGGLFIIGTERHDSRRIDNQLRGRAGRQGDPGETRFYISLEDDLMRLFGSERVMDMMEKMGVDEDTPIEQKVLSNAIESAQKKIESRNFQSRKNTLEFDDVMNTQRALIYEQRKQVLDGEDLQESMKKLIHTSIGDHVASAAAHSDYITPAVFTEMCTPYMGLFLLPDMFSFTDQELEGMTVDQISDLFYDKAMAAYSAKEEEVTSPIMRELERVVMLRVVDEYWMDHISAMDELRRGISLRAYANEKPTDAYKREGYEMFSDMISAIQSETLRRMYLIRVKKDEEIKRERVAKESGENAGGDDSIKKQPRKVKKVGRNDPCPCGSGLKYKKCCGRNEK